MRNVGVFAMAVLLGNISVSSGVAADDAVDSHVAAESGSAALLGDCESMKVEFWGFAWRAAAKLEQAKAAFDADPGSDLEIRYFGEYVDRAKVSAIMGRAAERGRSGTLDFICHDPETTQACIDYPTMAFWVYPQDALRTEGWEINVCGVRFWDYLYVNGYDGRDSATQVGIMVHELSHLGGATSDQNTLDEITLMKTVANMSGSQIASGFAESYRHYTMRIE
jgi:hypothetical protein